MKQLITILTIFLLSSCASESTQNDISDEDVTAFAKKEGMKISDRAQQALGSQLMAAMEEGGPVYAVRFCNTAAWPILDTIASPYDITIKRVSQRWRNPADAPNQTESEILADYQQQTEAGKAPEPVMRVKDDHVVFTRPIVLNKPLCLNCHGEPGTQVAEETLQLLGTLYPEDKALGHQMNDLRGMWSITFVKPELISYLENAREAKD